MKYLFWVFFIALTAASYAQNDAPVIAKPPSPTSQTVFDVVELMPEFPGGEDSMKRFIKNNLKYPDVERDIDIRGRVIVGFIVEKDGSLSNIIVKRGVTPARDKEAMRVVESMPKFKPGKQQGVPVRVRYVIPIVFSPD